MKGQYAEEWVMIADLSICHAMVGEMKHGETINNILTSFKMMTLSTAAQKKLLQLVSSKKKSSVSSSSKKIKAIKHSLYH